MKFLNKIIFINSANISYAEIQVDGNVHFTGTQGVGKSTVLRALLFFYNANKLRLGINKEQKSFDEFYFRQSNSYILYEVMRNNEAYTILLSRYQGRATWRFIDAPYQKEWLIDSSGQVLSDWVKIRERIDRNIAVSARIESGAVFKDIIFGNTHDHKYTRYALVQSSYYQSIPLSIQNVFLNTKLDAGFIKNTIIQSMAEEEIPLDLQTYRRQVTDFEREYDEIDCWFRRAKDGSYPVRMTAQKIAEQGRIIVAHEQQLLSVWHQLNFAVNDSKKQLPILESNLSDVVDEINTQKRLEQEVSEAFNKDKDSYNQQLGAQKFKLRDITSQRKYFESINIKEKLALSNREAALKQEHSQIGSLLENILRTHASIEEKYNIAKGKLENERRTFQISQADALNRMKEQLQEALLQCEEECTKSRNMLMDDHAEWRKGSDERLHMLREEQHRADMALREVRQWHPKANEIKQVDEEIQQLLITEKENKAQQETLKSKIESIENERELRADELKKDNIVQQDKLNAEKARLQDDIAKLESILSRFNGSLYEWLNKNKDGWQDTIGKVIDEEQVLYAQGLEPALCDSSNGLYGITINLENIPYTHRSPDELRNELLSLTDELKSISQQLKQLPVDLDTATQKLSKKFSERLNPLREQLTRLRVEGDLIPAKRQEFTNLKHSLEMGEQELRDAEEKVRHKAFDEAILQVQAENDSRSKREAKHKKELTEIEASFKKQVRQQQDTLKQFQEQQSIEAETRNADFDKQIKDIEAQKNNELAGNGVDVALCNKYRDALNEIERLLKIIEDQRPIVVKYQILESTFAQEPTIRKEIKSLELKLENIRQKYDDKRAAIIKKQVKLEETERNIKKDIAHRKDGIALYHQMVENEHLVPDSFLTDDTTSTTSLDCQKLISNLRGTCSQKRQAIETLKNAVLKFNCNFAPNNAFHFNTNPLTENDYLLIAANLQEFLDNNKIEEYRRRTSEHYKDILGRISVEIGELMKRRSDVDRIILDINRDFIEKNFAGVIRSIELKASASSDKLMQLLLSIHSYTEENALSMGEINLFSQDNHEEVNRQVISYLKSLTRQLQDEPQRKVITLGDTFRLQFRVVENDNDTGWAERINNVGSDGTDILVKAMVNIMLINVFKKKAEKKSGEFIVHCMMDEIGRLHPTNIKGILQFANSRNIYLINSSPTSYNPYDYKYTYMLSKHNLKTRVEKLLKRNN